VADGIVADSLFEHFQASPLRSKRQRLFGFESAPPIGTRTTTDKNSHFLPGIRRNHGDMTYTLTTSCATSIILSQEFKSFQEIYPNGRE
jgi:hypothetical protein